MGKAGVGKVEGVVQLVLCEGLVGRIDHSIVSVHLLNDALGGIFVGLFLYVTEVFGLCFFVSKAFFVAVQENVIGAYASWNFFFF